MRYGLLLLAACLCGCAGTQSHVRYMQQTNAIAVMPGSGDHDFVVSIKNVVDIGYNPDNQSQRYAYALKAAGCPGGRVVSDRFINQGNYLTRPARTYFVKVKC